MHRPPWKFANSRARSRIWNATPTAGVSATKEASMPTTRTSSASDVGVSGLALRAAGLIAEGDRVVAHMPYRGTHGQAILGVAPTHRSCTVDEIVIFRIADGKIAEAWEVYDEAGMWRQLGFPGHGQ
jgi:hypothetical protein